MKHLIICCLFFCSCHNNTPVKQPCELNHTGTVILNNQMGIPLNLFIEGKFQGTVFPGKDISVSHASGFFHFRCEPVRNPESGRIFRGEMNIYDCTPKIVNINQL